MKYSTIAGIAFGMVVAVGLTGCMSMDEMLASDDALWRDVGETKAVDFAIDSANPLEKRLEVVPKIANQQKLAKIVISKRAAPEVKVEARKRINTTPALAAIALDAPDRNDQLDALRQIIKSEDSRIEAAWIFAERKSSSNAPQTLLKGLSDAGKAKFAISFTAKIDTASAVSAEAGRLRRKYGDSMASGKQKELKAILKSLVRLVPFVEDENVIVAILKRQDISDVRGSEYDFLSPLERQYQTVVAERQAREAREFLAALTDDERVMLLKHGKILKQSRTVIVGDGAGSAANTVKISRDDVLKGIKNPELSNRIAKEEPERKAREEEQHQRAAALAAKKANAIAMLDNAGIFNDITKPTDIEGAAHDIALYKGPGRWLKAVAVFDGEPELQQEFIRLMFKHTGHDRSDGKDKQEANDKMLAKLPPASVSEMFLEAVGDSGKTQLAYALSRNIKDQGILRKLLVDDDSWARNMRIVSNGINQQRLEMAYGNLVANVTDVAIADHLFFVTRPTAKKSTIHFQTIGSLMDRISADKRKVLTEQAFARSAEVAKTNIVVKGFYPGMSYVDYMMINLANGNPSKAFTYDTMKSRKVVQVTFLREHRNDFLGIVSFNPYSAILKFKELYGKVNDGVDVSDKTEIAASHRTTKSLESHNTDSFWKFVDYHHGFQAEVNANTGDLTLREVVIEDHFNKKDTTLAETFAIADAFDSLDDKPDTSPDEGLEPVGKWLVQSN